jgi:hypothetical protein
MKPAARALNEEQVKIILEAEHLTSRALAQIMGVSMNTVQKIRRGYSYRSVVPDVPRWEDARPTRYERDNMTCERCIHWIRGCTMGFPEAQRSMLFARQCSVWSPND